MDRVAFGVRGRDRQWGELAAVLIAALAAGGAAGLLFPPLPSSTSLAASGPKVSDTTSNLSMAIVPGTWTVVAASSAVFSVSVVGAPDGCDVASATPSWWLPGFTGSAGFLNRSAGPSVTFTTFSSAAGGFGEISVSGPVVLDCGGNDYGEWAEGFASVTVVATATLSGPYVTPADPSPGAPALVRWSLSGGLPPYSVTVTFGDGTSANLTQSDPGSGEVVHRFTAGVFTPSLSVSDSQGHGLNQSVEAPVPVAYGMSVAIEGPGPVVDVGRPFVLTVNITGGIAPFDVRWKGPGAPFVGDQWGLTLQDAERFNATVWVTDLYGDSVVTSTWLTAVDPPTVSVAGPVEGSDAGQPFAVRFNVSGGTGPYNLVWGVAPGGANSTASVAADGEYVEPATATAAGPDWLTVRVVDALGGNETVSVELAPVHPLPETKISASPAIAEPGLRTTFALAILGGTPPFRWSITPSGEVDASGPSSGLLLAVGSVDWACDPASEANLSVTATVTDADGVTVAANLSVPIVPELRPVLASAESTPGAGASVPFSAVVQGGLPPYALAWSGSDGERGVGNLSTAGPVTFSLVPASPGFLSVTLSISDALGEVSNVSTQVLVLAASAPPISAPMPAGPDPGTSWTLLGAGALAVGAVAWGVWNRRPPSVRPSPPNAASGGLAVVRRLLSESGELEGETLTFLAEEEGVAPEATREAVARWTRAGRIRSEPGGDGETVLRWDPAGHASLDPLREESP